MTASLPPGYALAQSDGRWYVEFPTGSESAYEALSHDSEADAETTAWLDYATTADPTPWRAFRALCVRYAEIRHDDYGERTTGLGSAAVGRALGRDPRLVRRWCCGQVPVPTEAAWRLREIVAAS